MKAPRFIVASNGKFHSFALCAALERRGLLARLYTPYYSQCDRLVARFARRQDQENFSPQHVRTNVWTELGPRVSRHLPGLSRYADYFKAVWFDRWVARHLEQEEADVFLGWSNSSLLSLDVARRRGMQTILTRGSSHIDAQFEVLAREHARRGLAFHPPYGIAERERQEYDKAQYIRIPSSYVKRSFLQHRVPESKLLLVPYTADIAHFRPYPRDAGSIFRVLLLNAISLRKGFYYAVEMIDRLNATCQDKIEFWLIGDPEHGLARQVRALGQKWDNVKVLGRVNHYDLARQISQCDVAVFPSIEEGMATAVPQTMACGVPVIATISTGAEDLVDDGVEGFLVPIMDTDALVDHVCWCHENPDRLSEMGHAAARRVSQRSWDDFVTDLLTELEAREEKFATDEHR
jgi:glycosyltransferase involved in cell wall biosynthesis